MSVRDQTNIIHVLPTFSLFSSHRGTLHTLHNHQSPSLVLWAWSLDVHPCTSHPDPLDSIWTLAAFSAAASLFPDLSFSQVCSSLTSMWGLEGIWITQEGNTWGDHSLDISPEQTQLWCPWTSIPGLTQVDLAPNTQCSTLVHSAVLSMSYAPSVCLSFIPKVGVVEAARAAWSRTRFCLSSNPSSSFIAVSWTCPLTSLCPCSHPLDEMRR